MAYRSFVSSRLIALDKNPGVILVRVIETSRCLISKIFIKVTRSEAIMVCQDYRLCTSHKAEIYGTVHVAQAIWDKKMTTEDWGFLPVDAKYAFNEINRIMMLWKVHHL